jgi:hypothetical protein
LEGNISTTLDFLTKSRLSDYLSSLFEALSETTTREKTFDGYMKTAEEKGVIIKKVWEIAVSATTIPLSVFTNYFTRGSRSIYIWNQHWKFCGSSILR